MPDCGSLVGPCARLRIAKLCHIYVMVGCTWCTVVDWFVLRVWAVYEAHRGPGAPELAITSVHHKASVEESGGDEGVTWWSRACNTDREAIILLDSTDAELLWQNAEHYRRPPKPRSPPLYCYIGCGLNRQPTCITGIVVRTALPALTAAVATACRILGLSFPGEKIGRAHV